mmetsp:Transcript_13321/g.30496  ORF Transcript_13321/g.30496 Transcript_13321/m.30496 type:complete len:224 (-) Transcript_13321:202-873(-)
MSSPFWRCTSTTRLVGVASFEASSLSYTLASPTDQNESSSLTTSDSGASTITSPCTLTVKCFLAMFALMSRPFVPSGTNMRIATSCSVCVQLPHVAVPPFPAFGRWRCLSSSSSSSLSESAFSSDSSEFWLGSLDADVPLTSIGAASSFLLFPDDAIIFCCFFSFSASCVSSSNVLCWEIWDKINSRSSCVSSTSTAAAAEVRAPEGAEGGAEAEGGDQYASL